MVRGRLDAVPVGQPPDPGKSGRDWAVGDTSGGFLAELQASTSSSCTVPDFQRGIFEMKKKIDINAVPELSTSVGMHGSLKHKEVGGPICLGIAIAILYAL